MGNGLEFLDKACRLLRGWKEDGLLVGISLSRAVPRRRKTGDKALKRSAFEVPPGSSYSGRDPIYILGS